MIKRYIISIYSEPDKVFKASVKAIELKRPGYLPLLL